MDVLSLVKGFSYFVDIIIFVKFVASGVMCVYGYKWSKGLIATMSLGIGVSLSILVTYWLLRLGAGEISFLAIPVIVIWFYEASYKNIFLNHFLAGFLVMIKISTMIMILFMENGIIDVDGAMLFVVPIPIAVVFGIIGCLKLNNYIILFCMSFIGATEFVPNVEKLINGTLFSFTGDYSYIFSLDPTEMFFSFMGIDVPSTLEIIFILIIFAGGFWYQKKIVDKNKIDLTGTVLDDTGDKAKMRR